MALQPGKYDALKPDIELFDFKSKKRYGLKLDGNGLQVGTISQDDSVLVRNAGKRVGDFDEQRSWKGGRAVENLSDNAEGFYDSMNAWTLSENRVHPTLLWEFAKGIRGSHHFMPDNTHSVTWKTLLATTLYMANTFTHSGASEEPSSGDYVRLWIRRVGTPGTLTVKLSQETANAPGTVLKTATITTADVPDTVSVLQKFDWTGTQSLSNQDYWISIYGDAADNKNNHWEVGGYDTGANGLQSTDGSSWSAASFDPYFYLASSEVKKIFFTFFLDGAMYVVDRKIDGVTASEVWINGDRGMPTSATASSLTDTLKTWTTNMWAGAMVRIIRGRGKHQVRGITANSASALSVDVDWDTTPDTTSQYVIYSTEHFIPITAAMSVVMSEPCVANRIAYFPQGEDDNVLHMVYNTATKAHAFTDDGSNRASFMSQISLGGQNYVVKVTEDSSDVSIAPAADYSNTPSNLVFGSIKRVGSVTSRVTGIVPKENLIYIFKEDGVFTADKNLNVVRLTGGFEKTPFYQNGLANIIHGEFVYYNWQHSLIRIYGQTHDDIGQDWSGKGLPDGREGTFFSLDSYTSLLIGGINADTGTSSVLGFDGIAYHELLRAYDANRPVTMVRVAPCPMARTRMWVGMGDNLVFQKMPFMKGSPRLDSGVRYQHEAVIESSAIDMGTASGLPKFVKELTILSENLGSGNDIAVDYQVDENVGTTNWVEAGTIYNSPEATIYLGLDNIRKFAYRLRIHCADNTTPPVVRGVTPNGYARAPYKMIWTLRCRADNITSRGRIVKPAELMRWLLDSARYPGRVMMLSQYELAHKFFVIIHPPRMFPYKPAAAGQAEESIFTIVLEES